MWAQIRSNPLDLLPRSTAHDCVVEVRLCVLKAHDGTLLVDYGSIGDELSSSRYVAVSSSRRVADRRYKPWLEGVMGSRGLKKSGRPGQSCRVYFSVPDPRLGFRRAIFSEVTSCYLFRIIQYYIRMAATCLPAPRATDFGSAGRSNAGGSRLTCWPGRDSRCSASVLSA